MTPNAQAAQLATDTDDLDAAQVTAVLAGDQAGFAQLYRRHAPVVSQRLRRILADQDDTADVLQMVFLEAYRSLGSWRRKGPFRAWLHRLAFNVSASFIRSKRRKWWLRFYEPGASSLEPEADAKRVELQVEQRLLVGAMREAFLELSPQHRAAITMHDIEGLGPTEIGELAGVSPQAAWQRVQRARKCLRRSFDERARKTAKHARRETGPVAPF